MAVCARPARTRRPTFYLAAAPANGFAERLPELVRVLQSFSSRPPSRTASALRFAPVTEPREQAYSLQFPAGWNHSLGVYREGAIYDPSGIHPMRVLRSLPGERFVQYWLPTRLNGARVVGLRPRPDWASQLAAVRYRYGNAVNAQVHAGELTFDYQGQRGTVMVATEFYRAGADGAKWTVCFFADRDHARAMETIASTNQLFRQTFAERVASSDRNARAHGDLLAGSNFYYRVNGTITVVGSNTELAAVDLTRMLRLDWDTP